MCPLFFCDTCRGASLAGEALLTSRLTCRVSLYLCLCVASRWISEPCFIISSARGVEAVRGRLISEVGENDIRGGVADWRKFVRV